MASDSPTTASGSASTCKTCKTCGEPIPDQAARKKHNRLHQTRCQLSFPGKPAIHVFRNNDGNWYCPYCGVACPNGALQIQLHAKSGKCVGLEESDSPAFGNSPASEPQGVQAPAASATTDPGTSNQSDSIYTQNPWTAPYIKEVIAQYEEVASMTTNMPLVQADPPIPSPSEASGLPDPSDILPLLPGPSLPQGLGPQPPWRLVTEHFSPSLRSRSVSQVTSDVEVAYDAPPNVSTTPEESPVPVAQVPSPDALAADANGDPRVTPKSEEEETNVQGHKLPGDVVKLEPLEIKVEPQEPPHALPSNTDTSADALEAFLSSVQHADTLALAGVFRKHGINSNARLDIMAQKVPNLRDPVSEVWRAFAQDIVKETSGDAYLAVEVAFEERAATLSPAQRSI